MSVAISETPLEDDVREFLLERRDRGNTYVKTAVIADAVGESSQRVTPVVLDLVDAGALEIFRDPARNARTYRIVIEGSG